MTFSPAELERIYQKSLQQAQAKQAALDAQAYRVLTQKAA